MFPLLTLFFKNKFKIIYFNISAEEVSINEVPHLKSTRNQYDASRKKSTPKRTASGKINRTKAPLRAQCYGEPKEAVNGANDEREESNHQRSGKAVPEGKKKGERRDVE